MLNEMVFVALPLVAAITGYELTSHLSRSAAEKEHARHISLAPSFAPTRGGAMVWLTGAF